jgi:SAM-dependent methyltransferase
VKTITNSLLFGIGTLAGTQIGLRAGCYWEPRPMPHQLAAWLDHPLRQRYRNPGATLGLYGLMAGMSVLELGCGTGTFTAEMARMVGREGSVHVVELQKPMLEKAKQRVTGAGLAERVQFHHGGAYSLPLRDDSIDVAILIAVLGQIPLKAVALREVRRVLKPEGRLIVSEELPDPAYLPPWSVQQWTTQAGFRPGGSDGNLFCYSAVYFPNKGPGVAVYG